MSSLFDVQYLSGAECILQLALNRITMIDAAYTPVPLLLSFCLTSRLHHGSIRDQGHLFADAEVHEALEEVKEEGPDASAQRRDPLQGPLTEHTQKQLKAYSGLLLRNISCKTLTRDTQKPTRNPSGCHPKANQGGLQR